MQQQYYHPATDTYISPGVAFTLNGKQYAANWLHMAKPIDLAAAGLVSIVVIGQREDERYFDHSETLSNGIRTIVAVRKELKALQLTKWKEIETERDRRKLIGYKVGDYWFHGDEFSRSQQLGLLRKADRIEAAGGDMDAPFLKSNGVPLMWKTIGGKFVPITARLAQQIFEAAMESDSEIFEAAIQHRKAMEASDAPLTYDFSTKWPKTYGEI